MSTTMIAVIGMWQVEGQDQSTSNLLISSVGFRPERSKAAGESEEFLEPRTSPSSPIGQLGRALALIGQEIWARWGLELLGRLPRIADDENCWC